MRQAISPIVAAAFATICVVAADPALASDFRADRHAPSPHPNMGWTQNDRFRSTMDQLFGSGRWRETSGYRSPAQENRLRAEGAGTVPAGRLSAHSLGTPDAPGAYDAVVYGMSQARAANVLRASGTEFADAFSEGARGPEGGHLHINVGGHMEAASYALPIERLPRVMRAARVVARVSCDSIYMRVVDGRRNPQLASCSSSPG
jgi:hypothetical protein